MGTGVEDSHGTREGVRILTPRPRGRETREDRGPTGDYAVEYRPCDPEQSNLGCRTPPGVETEGDRRRTGITRGFLHLPCPERASDRNL